MRNKFVLIVLVFCQTLAFAQIDLQKLGTTYRYIDNGEMEKAKKLLDEMNGKKEYQSDARYWLTRTSYYIKIVSAKTNSTNDLTEAQKSFEKLVELNNGGYTKIIQKLQGELNSKIYESERKNKLEQSVKDTQSSSISQTSDEGKTVTLTQIGQGKTKNDAKYDALRNALEKAFGTFISSNTTLLKDELEKDEIVSLSSGNIQNFEILSETQMPDGSFSSVVKATVSLGKLVSFCENKGISVEFKGGLFTANIKLQKLKTVNEEAVMENLFNTIEIIIEKGFDYTVNVSDPKKSDDYSNGWNVPIVISAKSNMNMNNIGEIIQKTIEGISLSVSEKSGLKSQNIPTYDIILNGKLYSLRSFSSAVYLMDLFKNKIPIKSLDFLISNGLTIKQGNEIIGLINKYNNNNDPRLLKEKSVLGYVRADNRENYLEVNYPVLERYNSNGTLVEDKHTIKEILTKYSRIDDSNNNTYTSNSFEPQIMLNLNNISKIEFSFYLSNLLSENDLSKITEYKTQPINQ